jgi:cell shape-determining protein MreC
MDLSKSVQEAIDSSIRDWLQSHWPWGWIVTNPGLSFLLLLLAIVLFWGLLGALGRGVQQGWIWVLRSPLKLLGLMQTRSGGFWNKIRLSSREQQIETVVQQLAENQQQQAELLTKLAALIARTKINN